MADTIPGFDTADMTPIELTRYAFEIADEAMFELLESEGVPGDEFHTVIGFSSESCEEVKTLAEASAAMQEAFEWLRVRGYVELGTDGEGEFAQVVKRPEDDDGFVGLPDGLFDAPGVAGLAGEPKRMEDADDASRPA